MKVVMKTMCNNLKNWKISNIKLEINSETKSIIYKNPGFRYKNKNNLPRNRYGSDNFDYCRFRCSGLPDASGVYALFITGEENPVYIGRAINLKKDGLIINMVRYHHEIVLKVDKPLTAR